MATLATQPNAASDVFAGGTTVLRVQFETSVNSGQPCGVSGVTIGITASGVGVPDSGTGTPVPATSAGITELGMGLEQYTWDVPLNTPPGSYIVTWSGVRASDGATVAYTQAVQVAANPAAVPLPGVYASVAQYRAWAGDNVTPQQRISVVLSRASEQIDVALVAAVYRTDADGMPLDAAIANVLVRACCAQAQYLIAVNDDAGVKREYAGISVGGVSYSRAPVMQGNALPPVCPQALAILRVAGVLPAAPLISW